MTSRHTSCYPTTVEYPLSSHCIILLSPYAHIMRCHVFASLAVCYILRYVIMAVVIHLNVSVVTSFWSQLSCDLLRYVIALASILLSYDFLLIMSSFVSLYNLLSHHTSCYPFIFSVTALYPSLCPGVLCGLTIFLGIWLYHRYLITSFVIPVYPLLSHHILCCLLVSFVI